MIQKRRSRSRNSVRSKPIKLPKEKKAFCSVCKREFPLKELAKTMHGWMCQKCLEQI